MKDYRNGSSRISGHNFNTACSVVSSSYTNCHTSRNISKIEPFKNCNLEKLQKLKLMNSYANMNCSPSAINQYRDNYHNDHHLNFRNNYESWQSAQNFEPANLIKNLREEQKSKKSTKSSKKKLNRNITFSAALVEKRKQLLSESSSKENNSNYISPSTKRKRNISLDPNLNCKKIKIEFVHI